MRMLARLLPDVNMQKAIPFSVGALTGLGIAVGYLRVREQLEQDRHEKQAVCKYGLPSSSLTTHTYSFHTLGYDRLRKIPVWVAERISRDHVTGTADRRKSRFRPDPSLPDHHTSTNEDYRRSGWSRGHMAPAGDFKHSQASMDDTFLLTNIVPQDLSNNSGYWNRLEMYCRKLTGRYDDVTIVSGPLFLPVRKKEEGGREKKVVTYEVIGENNVAVPTHLYKIVLAEKEGQQPTVGVFIIPNRPLGNEELRGFQVSLEDLERLTGTTFHSKLDRSKVQDLCVRESCQLMSKEKMDLFHYTRTIDRASSLENVEEIWREVEEKGIVPDDTLRQTYTNRKLELKQNHPKQL